MHSKRKKFEDLGVCIVTEVDEEFCVCRVTRATPETEYENAEDSVTYFGSYSSRDDAIHAAVFMNSLFSLVENS